MKYASLICMMLALCAGAYGQQPDTELRFPAPNAQQPDAAQEPLQSLPSEAGQIRQGAGGGTQVMVNLQILEVSLTKLKRLGFDSTRLTGNSIVKLQLYYYSF